MLPGSGVPPGRWRRASRRRSRPAGEPDAAVMVGADRPLPAPRPAGNAARRERLPPRSRAKRRRIIRVRIHLSRQPPRRSGAAGGLGTGDALIV
ncbi:hypothetical protein C882_0548 [Caenispirillum salinarum AK4]|uniref:Uncharacterized protein n=1 Tax=Caenispirillum salinarum AK4 TaxID=1238182 RepID=K9HKZ8_9PROT|nr:hypothetical protein C882_0548 [Caenispirillum salinarum AK4]